jgi:hypothetical protein
VSRPSSTTPAARASRIGGWPLAMGDGRVCFDLDQSRLIATRNNCLGDVLPSERPHYWPAGNKRRNGRTQMTDAKPIRAGALLGAVATEGGTFPSAWTKFVPRPMHMPPHPRQWNELTWPKEVEAEI